MPNGKEQLENEVKHLRKAFDEISEAWEEGFINEDGDRVIPEIRQDHISMLLENG